MKEYKRKITVGIPTLNSEENICGLVRAIIGQRGSNFELVEVIVYSDGSTDSTVSNLKAISNKKLKLIVSRKTRGFAHGLQVLIDNFKGDLLVVLNDDLVLSSERSISSLVAAFGDKNVGLVCGNYVPLEPKTFIEKAVLSSFNAYSKLKMSLRNGNNLYTCDGKVLAFSKGFAKKLRLEAKQMGNADTIIYLSCLDLGYKYKFVKEKIVFFRLPQTIADLKNQTVRAKISRALAVNRFGDLAVRELDLPKALLLRELIIEFFKNPVGSLVLFFVNHVYVNLVNPSDTFFTTWNLARSTKKLN